MQMELGLGHGIQWLTTELGSRLPCLVMDTGHITGQITKWVHSEVLLSKHPCHWPRDSIHVVCPLVALVSLLLRYWGNIGFIVLVQNEFSCFDSDSTTHKNMQRFKIHFGASKQKTQGQEDPRAHFGLKILVERGLGEPIFA